jgi:hypothetical protein
LSSASASSAPAPVTGLYVAGWLKRGPTGILGTNIPDAKETANSIAEDFREGRLESKEGDPLDAVLRLARARHGADKSADVDGSVVSMMDAVVTWKGYKRIVAIEAARGGLNVPVKASSISARVRILLLAAATATGEEGAAEETAAEQTHKSFSGAYDSVGILNFTS